MLNITNYEGNANQNHVNYHLIPVRMAIAKRTKMWSKGYLHSQLEGT